jgi:hypothetical protein
LDKIGPNYLKSALAIVGVPCSGKHMKRFKGALSNKAARKIGKSIQAKI